MHGDMKVGLSAVGDLVRTKNKKAVNPASPALRNVMAKNRAMASFVRNSEDRIEQLHLCCDQTGTRRTSPML